MSRRRSASAGREKPAIFRWLKALRVADDFKNKAGALRLGGELADLFNDDLGHAFPSRQYLSEELGTHQNTISEWTTALRESGALQTYPQGKLHPDLRRSSDPRSLIYVLNFEWADMILALHAQRRGLSGARPPVRRSVVESTSEPVVEFTSEVGSGVHYTDNLPGKPIDKPRQNGSDGSEHSVYGKEGEDIPFEAPDTMDEGLHFLRMRGLTEDRHLRMAIPLLMKGSLRQSHIDRLIETYRSAQRGKAA